MQGYDFYQYTRLIIFRMAQRLVNVEERRAAVSWRVFYGVKHDMISVATSLLFLLKPLRVMAFQFPVMEKHEEFHT